MRLKYNNYLYDKDLSHLGNRATLRYFVAIELKRDDTVAHKRIVVLVEQISEKRKNTYHMQIDALIELLSGERITIFNQWDFRNIELLIDFVRWDDLVVEKAG